MPQQAILGDKLAISPEQIGTAAEAVRRLAQKMPVLVVANNHYAGYAPATVESIRQHLQPASR